MPLYEVTDPNSGKVLELEGDSPPTEQELEQIFASQTEVDQKAAVDIETQRRMQEEKGFFRRLGDIIPSGQEQSRIARQEILEPTATIATGAVAEPIAGIAGAVTAPFVGMKQAQKNIEATREALTVKPRSETGKETLQTIGETLEPVAKAIKGAEKGVGDFAFKVTGSPTVAAIATALPAATIEALGFGLGRRVAKASTGLKAAPGKIKPLGKVSEKAVTKSLLESAPEVKQIKDASRAIYN